MHPLYPQSPRVPDGIVVEGKTPRPISETLFSFHGRRGRGQWWLFSIGLYIAPYLLFVVLGLLTELFRSSMWSVDSYGRRHVSDFGNAWESAIVLLILATVIVIFVASLANMVKRLHDLNRSGWLLILGVVPLILLATDLYWALNLSMFANFIVLLYIAFFPGTNGTNRFGEKP